MGRTFCRLLSRDGVVDDELSFASKVIIREEVEFKDNVSPTRVRSEAIRALFLSVRGAPRRAASNDTVGVHAQFFGMLFEPTNRNLQIGNTNTLGRLPLGQCVYLPWFANGR